MSSKKKAQQSHTIQNRRARFDYELGDSLVVGLELTGAEVKTVTTSGSASGQSIVARLSDDADDKGLGRAQAR